MTGLTMWALKPDQDFLVDKIADLFEEMDIGEQQAFVDPYRGISGWVTRTLGGYKVEMTQPTPRGAAEAVAAHIDLAIAVDEVTGIPGDYDSDARESARFHDTVA
jgi:hypothetical protein